ncbi:MAG: hypothetical protein ACM32O_08260 [Clostridia bacterium]
MGDVNAYYTSCRTNLGVALTPAHLAYWSERKETELVIRFLIEQVADPYRLGMSSHLLYIGSKV